MVSKGELSDALKTVLLPNAPKPKPPAGALLAPLSALWVWYYAKDCSCKALSLPGIELSLPLVSIQILRHLNLGMYWKSLPCGLVHCGTGLVHCGTGLSLRRQCG
jgi:hypothetical protein